MRKPQSSDRRQRVTATDGDDRAEGLAEHDSTGFGVAPVRPTRVIGPLWMCAVVGEVSYGGPWYSKLAEPKKAGEVNGIIWWIVTICLIAAISNGFPF